MTCCSAWKEGLSSQHTGCEMEFLTTAHRTLCLFVSLKKGTITMWLEPTCRLLTDALSPVETGVFLRLQRLERQQNKAEQHRKEEEEKQQRREQPLDAQQVQQLTTNNTVRPVHQHLVSYPRHLIFQSFFLESLTSLFLKTLPPIDAAQSSLSCVGGFSGNHHPPLELLQQIPQVAELPTNVSLTSSETKHLIQQSLRDHVAKLPSVDETGKA